jgi:hypothetical protein
MRIMSFGCSFTLGSELSDFTVSQHDGAPDSFSSRTWPALIAKSLGLLYGSDAHGGSGNLCILDRVLQNLKNSNDFYIINWSFIDRFDFSDKKGKHADITKNDYQTIRPGETDDFARYYYTHLHSEYRDRLTNLIYLKTIIDILKQQKKLFLMTCIDDLLLQQEWEPHEHITMLQNYIRPYIRDFEGKNFLEWSRCRGFRISDAGHPLDDAHAAAAELMLPLIRSLFK